jgi:putative flippase GtrA
LVSFLCAVTFTWAANRHLTFRSAAPGRPLAQWLRFASLNALGGAINLGVYALLVARVASVARQPILGVAAGSVAGLLINFLLSRWFVFRAHLASPEPTRTT